MLYYIYIGNSQTAIDHLSKVTNGMFVTVSGARKAAKIIDASANGITHPSFTSKPTQKRIALTSPASTRGFHAYT